MRTISKVLFVLAILSFLVIFALKMENNLEMEKYYLEKEEKAKQDLAILNSGLQDANGEIEFFEINDDKIKVINTATETINKIGDFADWCDVNFETQAPNCYYVFEDFVNSNDHIIPEINKIMNE